MLQGRLYPVQWSIIEQMAAVDELACVTLEDTLTVSRPTISYHTKILYHAGLISVGKPGRNHRQKREAHALSGPARKRRGARDTAAGQSAEEAVVLTW